MPKNKSVNTGNNYGAESIKVLKGLRGCKKKTWNVHWRYR